MEIKYVLNDFGKGVGKKTTQETLNLLKYQLWKEQFWSVPFVNSCSVSLECFLFLEKFWFCSFLTQRFSFCFFFFWRLKCTSRMRLLDHGRVSWKKYVRFTNPKPTSTIYWTWNSWKMMKTSETTYSNNKIYVLVQNKNRWFTKYKMNIETNARNTNIMNWWRQKIKIKTKQNIKLISFSVHSIECATERRKKQTNSSGFLWTRKKATTKHHNIIIIIIRRADEFHVLVVGDWLDSVWFLIFCHIYYIHAISIDRQECEHYGYVAVGCSYSNNIFHNACIGIGLHLLDYHLKSNASEMNQMNLILIVLAAADYCCHIHGCCWQMICHHCILVAVQWMMFVEGVQSFDGTSHTNPMMMILLAIGHC